MLAIGNPLTTKAVILLVLNRGSLHGRGIIEETMLK